MQRFYKIRHIAIIAIIATVTLLSSCGTKKYGCPNHLFTPTLFR